MAAIAAPAPAASGPSALDLPTITGLTLTGVLGAGGCATVYAARDDRGADVAVKVARTRDPVTVARFAAEARALALVGAPRVPRLLGCAETAARHPCLILERLDGIDLAGWLAARTSPPPAAVWIPIAVRLGAALTALHRVGLVHRDLKPENVFVRPDGEVTLIDLGLVAGVAGAAVTRTGDALGTSTYASPEQLRGEPVTAAADIYALGVILYELATLRVPFVGDAPAIEHAHLTRRPPAPGEHHPEAARFDAAILACLRKQAAERPADVVTALAALVTAVGATPGAPAPRTRRAHVTLQTHGARPVALVGVRTGRVDVLATLARRHGGVVARVLPGAGVIAMLDGDAPLERALAAAGGAPAGAVVHLARLGVRVDPGRAEPRLFGAALDEPTAWWPAGPIEGVLVTAAAAPLLAGRVRPATIAGFHEPAERGPLVELYGREPLVAALTVTLAGPRSQPYLQTLIGAPGVGKSAVAATVAARLGEAGGGVIVARPTLGGAGPDAVVAFAAAVLGVAAATAAGAACERLLGAERGAAIWATLQAPALVRRPLDVARALAAILIAVAPAAVVVDDAQQLPIEVLDAIELATATATATVAVLVVATPRLLELRPRWGARAWDAAQLTLPPLAAPAAAALLRAQLAPATRIANATIERLVAWAGGVPQQLVDLARTLRQAGAIRQHPGSDEWYLASDRIADLPADARAQWLAGRELAALTPELAELARMCAVLGDAATIDEVAAIAPSVPLAAALDARAGLEALVAAGLLIERAGRFGFRQAALQEACYAQCDAASRAAVHAQAYRYWLSAPCADALARVVRLAHHGARGGHVAEARAGYLALGADALSRHAYDEAAQHYDAALELCAAGDDHVRMMALGARATARRHLTHYEAARADIVAARALAEALGDRLAVVEALVAESAVCDFLQRYGEAAELAEAAAQRAPAALPPLLQARLANWLGVARFHQHRDAEALDLLSLAIALGGALGDHESEVGASLIAAHAYQRLGRPAAGLALLERVIARCREVGDYFHLACAHSNRVATWRELGESTRAAADLEAVVAIARDCGFALLEAAGLANLAEHLCWQGCLDEALAASRAAHAQSVRRFRDQPLAIVSLYHAQLLALAGHDAEVRAVVRELGAVDLSEPSVAIMHRAVAVALDAPAGADGAWAAVHAEAERLGAGLQPVEMRWLEARCRRRAGDDAGASTAYAVAIARAAPTAPAMAAAIARDRDAHRTRSP